MDNNTQKTEVTFTEQEHLVYQQFELIDKRAKGKYRWLYLLTLIPEIFIITLGIISFIVIGIRYNIEIAFLTILRRGWFLLFVLAGLEILDGLYDLLVAKECSTIIINENADYSTWLKMKKTQMDNVNQKDNSYSVIIIADEHLFYAVHRIKSKIESKDFLLRKIFECMEWVMLGIAAAICSFSVVVEIAMLVVEVVVAFMLSMVVSVIGNSKKRMQRNNMANWVNMTVTKLENEDLKGYDKDLYLK